LIRIDNLRVIYRGGVIGIDGLNTTIPAGKITCILGPNGSGKTTLLKAISKMVRFEGAIYIDGLEVRKTPLKVLARILSYTSTLSVVDILSLTVREALLTARYPLSKGFFESREDIKLLMEIASELKLVELLDRKLYELSGGELQRVILGTALMKKPKYMLFDEPDSHMDLGYKAQLIIWLKKWKERSTIVLSTHDIMFGYDIGDYFIVLSRGRPVFIGDRMSLYNSVEILEKVYGVVINRLEINGEKKLVPIYKVRE
jgi:iron complex transport system ATP-binding protein